MSIRSTDGRGTNLCDLPRVGRFFSDEDGAGTAFSLFLLLILLMFSGLAIDYANGERMRSQLQAAADAGAAAAIIRISDHAEASARAIELASANAPTARNGNVVMAEDVVFGHWNNAEHRLEVGVLPINAVEVTARRAAANGNALPTFLMQFVGVDRLDVAARSVTLALPANCSGGGFFSRGKVNSGSNNDYRKGFCLYGDLGVKIGSDTYFEAGTSIEMPQLSDFAQSGSNTGVDEALRQATMTLTLPDLVPGIVTAMLSGNLSTAGLPGYITQVSYVNEITSSTVLMPHTLYIVQDVADIGSDAVLSDIAIVAGKEIKTGSNVRMHNVVFATTSKILFGSNNDFGTRDFCDWGTYSISAFAVDNIEFGSQSLIRGMQMASRSMIKLGSELRAADGVYAEAIGDIEYGSTDTFVGCADGLYGDLPIAALPGRVALVQ